MTAVVSRERARTTGLTAAAGVLMLAVAFVMMIVAAPGHGPVRAHLARSSAVRLTTDVCHQLTSKSDSPAVRACQAVRPPWAGLFSADRTGTRGLQPRYSSSVTCSPQ